MTWKSRSCSIWIFADKENSVFENGSRMLQHLPEIVFVKCFDKSGNELPWTLPGLKEPGLYPIVPRSGASYLDNGRFHPVLNISRRRFALTPALAMTAHASQGRTFNKSAIVDLKSGGSSRAMSSYVASTRGECRSDLLMFRPFPRMPFCKTNKSLVWKCCSQSMESRID